ncbi:AAA family ATPase [Parenemella sanctibonifatiensis]|nr:MoxR family ATPase [Parenemella sanctibonifatiensis]
MTNTPDPQNPAETGAVPQHAVTESGHHAPSSQTSSQALGSMPFDQAVQAAADVVKAVSTVVVGKEEELSFVLAGILAGGHVLLEDYPGLGKTLAARSLAQALGLKFDRVQFTPDLLPSDVTGSFLYNQGSHEFEFREGPLFTGLLLADEINRTPPKTQSALLEAMQEKQVTVEGTTHQLPRPFHVLATANPIEYEGTYPLPEAQLDRFLLRLGFGYPDQDQEWDILERRMQRRTDDTSVPQVIDAEGLLALQSAVEDVRIDESIGRYCVRVAAATRGHNSILVGASPRGSQALLTVSRAVALIRGRDYVVPEDIKDIAVYALAHRITIKPELWLQQITAEQVIAEVLASVPVPSDANTGAAAQR